MCRRFQLLYKSRLRVTLRLFREISATVNSFDKLEDVPTGYWPITVRDDINTPGAGGIHEDKNGQPFALVQADIQHRQNSSSPQATKRVEMLVDPFGNRLITGHFPKAGQGRVSFLVEVCDPSEASDYAYSSNGVLVSDFYTPHYFRSRRSSRSEITAYTSAIRAPQGPSKGRVPVLGGPCFRKLVAANLVSTHLRLHLGISAPSIRRPPAICGRRLTA